VLHFFERIIAPCRPCIIAYYCGSNDIECGEGPASIAARFEAFCARVRQELPRCRVFFVSINLSPQKRAHWHAIEAANCLVAELCAGSSARGYIDVNAALCDACGQPHPGFYQEDGLHLRPAAYQALGARVRPVLLQAWQEVTSPHG
jgi:lysophospholipase L1-like esterase